MRLNSQPECRNRWSSLQGRGEVVGWGNSTLVESPKRCLDKTWALQRLENLLASKHWVLEALLVTISDLTAFWHVRSLQFYFGTE